MVPTSIQTSNKVFLSLCRPYALHLLKVWSLYGAYTFAMRFRSSFKRRKCRKWRILRRKREDEGSSKIRISEKFEVRNVSKRCLLSDFMTNQYENFNYLSAIASFRNNMKLLVTLCNFSCHFVRNGMFS